MTLALVVSIGASFSQTSSPNNSASQFREVTFVTKNAFESQEIPNWIIAWTELLTQAPAQYKAEAFFINGERFETKPMQGGPVGETHCGLTLKSEQPFHLAPGDKISLVRVIDTVRSPPGNRLAAITYEVKHAYGTGTLRCVAGLFTKELTVKNIIYNLGEELSLENSNK